MVITNAKYVISSPDYKGCPAADRPEFAFIGRSNVGKSSLINMLCNARSLAKTSATPGKTQLINHFDITGTVPVSQTKNTTMKWYLVDLPGYGYAKVSQSSRRRWEQMIEGYIRKRENLVNLFVLIDSRHEPQAIDVDFVNQLGEWGIPFSIVFTKEDKNKPGGTVNRVNAFLKKLGETWDELPTSFISSAVTKKGQKEIADFIGATLKNLGAV